MGYNPPIPPKSQRSKEAWDGAERRDKKQWPMLQVGSKVYYSLKKPKTQKDGWVHLLGEKLSYRKCDYD
jgi:hypothetical protein